MEKNNVFQTKSKVCHENGVIEASLITAATALQINCLSIEPKSIAEYLDNLVPPEQVENKKTIKQKYAWRYRDKKKRAIKVMEMCREMTVFIEVGVREQQTNKGKRDDKADALLMILYHLGASRLFKS